MGFLPPNETKNGMVITGTACHNCTVAASEVTVNDIINVHGPRVPSSATSQKSFRVATIVLTRDRLLTDDEMTLFEFFASRGELKTPVNVSAGLSKYVSNPWYVATRGLSTVDLRITTLPARRRATHH
jgi:hypothetical protein